MSLAVHGWPIHSLAVPNQSQDYPRHVHVDPGLVGGESWMVGRDGGGEGDVGEGEGRGG